MSIDNRIIKLNDIETPALLLDLDTANHNLEQMMCFIKGKGVNLRPHTKLYRATPELVRMQIEAGAVGMTCAKISEAEILFSAGVRDILVANEIVDTIKIYRLVELARSCEVKVCVDNKHNIDDLSTAAKVHGVSIGVLIEVNIGHNRCGVAPFEPTLELANYVLSKPGLKFNGLMGYDGHCTLKISEKDREMLSKQANRLLGDTKVYLEQRGIKVDIVSGAGTFTYRYAAEIEDITEVQAGSYLLMDTTFREHGVREFECALSVLTTVISQPNHPDSNNMVIVDVGRKSISPLYGNPEVKNIKNASVLSLSDEHGRVVFEKTTNMPQVGERIEFWVRDANATINQFDRFYVIQGGAVKTIWPIPLCGDHT